MFVEAVKGLTSALAIYEKRKTIAQIARRWTHLLIHGTARVGVFGAGGTGKTTLGSWLTGDLDTDRAVGEYQETIAIEHFKMPGEIPALLSVVPGQEARRPTTWAELYRELASGKSFRVINVVSWGHHASGIERARHRAYDASASDDAFRAAYFEDSRIEEIKALQTLVPHLSAVPGAFRMVTLVTKQDLWWPDRRNVEAFYMQSAYAEAIEQIRSARGAANFQHEFLSCALVEQNLRMADGFLLAETAAGYDDPLRVANLSKVASAIEQIISP